MWVLSHCLMARQLQVSSAKCAHTAADSARHTPSEQLRARDMHCSLLINCLLLLVGAAMQYWRLGASLRRRAC